MKFIWPESERAELRAIDREIASRILRALTEYGESRTGDIRALSNDPKWAMLDDRTHVYHRLLLRCCTSLRNQRGRMAIGAVHIDPNVWVRSPVTTLR
jgi:hypothetical protein